MGTLWSLLGTLVSVIVENSYSSFFKMALLHHTTEPEKGHANFV